jgi:hypothetical protein
MAVNTLREVLSRLSPEAREIFAQERAAALKGGEEETGANAPALFAALRCAIARGEIPEAEAAAYLQDLDAAGPAALRLEPSSREAARPEHIPEGEALAHFLARLPVVLSIDQVARWGGKDGAGGDWKRDPETVGAWIQANPEDFAQGRRQLRTLPSLGGFLVLDLDRGHAGQEDGIENLPELFKAKGLPLPAVLRDLDRVPAFTRSPSGGLHLWFKCRDFAGLPSGAIAPGIEIHGDRALITIPPSTKAGKGPYRFYGSLDDAPELEALGGLLRLLKYAKAKEPRPPEKDLKKYSWERPPLATIFGWAKAKAGQDAPARAAGWAYDVGYQPAGIREAAKEAGFPLDAIDAALYAKAEAKDKRPELAFIFDWTFNGRTGANKALFSASGWAYRSGYSRAEVEAEARARGYDPSNPVISHALREGR